MVMKRGDVVEAGDADAIFDAPQNDYTREELMAAFGWASNVTDASLSPSISQRQV
jgi:ABC-type glutathione transport system ATPase component